ncbi:ribonuclease HI family protein [Vagococcus sp. JNUCC 83]
MIKINTDSSTHPKYKKSVGCFVIKNDGNIIIETFPLDAADNHTAEFKTVIKALQYCLDHCLSDNLIYIYSDSKIVVSSINKRYVKNELFTPLLDTLITLTKSFKNLTIEWIPENQNKMADHHAKQALQKELKYSKK